jgi:bacterioferritin-associated ferredoxin
MIVCSCHAVSDRALRDALAAGASLDEVIARTRAGTDCGCCKDEVHAIAAERPHTSPCRATPCAGCPRRAAA